MNYKDLILKIEGLIDEHLMVNEYGYGDLSDISTPSDKEPPNYPYMFLNPVSVALNNRTSVFSFNLISMTQIGDTYDELIDGQSLTYDILKDVISRINYIIDGDIYKVQLPLILTPFKERFDDDVVGFTATINIEYSDPLNACDRPNTL